MLYHVHYEPVSHDAFIKNKPYNYQWTTTLRELKRIKKMERKLQCLQEQPNTLTKNIVSELTAQITAAKSFFNRPLAETMLKQYIETDLPNYLWRASQNAHYANRFDESDTNITVIDINTYVQHMLDETDDDKFLELFEDFVKHKVIAPSTIPKCGAWIEAFKHNGAYFTMRDLIRYHQCTFEDHPDAGMDKSLSLLNQIPTDNLFDQMNKMIRYNHCSAETLYA